jgi:hypothetical protein
LAASFGGSERRRRKSAAKRGTLRGVKALRGAKSDVVFLKRRTESRSVIGESFQRVKARKRRYTTRRNAERGQETRDFECETRKRLQPVRPATPRLERVGMYPPFLLPTAAQKKRKQP